MNAPVKAPTTPRRTIDERAFLPAAMEIIETPAPPLARWTASALCAVVLGALLWACLGEIDIVAVADGKVIPLGQVKVVQPLETAVIRSIHVEEGDHVEAGQPLLELDPTEAAADLDSIVYDLRQASLDAEVARVLLTLDPETELVAPDGTPPGLAEAAHNQARAEIERHLAAQSAIQAEIAQKSAQHEANLATIQRARDTIPLLIERHAALDQLLGKGFGARPPVLELQQQLIERRSDHRIAEATAHQIAAEMEALQNKAREARAAFVAEATDRRTKALQRQAQLTQQLAKARQREHYRHLVAPVAGTVQQVKVHTPGAVVTTADVLMTVVPDGTGVEIEASVQNKDVGFVREGQPVEVKVEAFPFTRYGLLRGHVRRLGRDAAAVALPGADPRAGPGSSPPADLVYPARIGLDQDVLEVDGRPERLRPGMRVSAEIRTGKRRVISFLLSPILEVTSEAGRER